MRSNRPELIKQMTDVLDEMIPAIPVDDRTSALIARIGECILKAAAEEQASYETLLAAASAEMGAISKERTSPPFTQQKMVRATPLQICNNDHSQSHLQANRWMHRLGV
jgi:hypothetical protein